MSIKRKVERGKPLSEVLAPAVIPATSFQAVTFFDEAQKRQVIVLYALGEDGIVRELINNRWNQYPITSDQEQ